MNATAQRKEQLLHTLQQMHDMLDENRWRRMPALRQQLMVLFEQYRQMETNDAALADVKQTLRDGFTQLIARREQRVDELSKKMEQHRDNKEGVLAYSMMALLTEQA